MEFNIDRETLLRPLRAVQGVVERRQTLPILGNVLMVVGDEGLSVTATDMELELVARVELETGEGGETTVPARKLIDICRSLPADARVGFRVEGDRAIVRSGRSKFALATLPVAEFPAADTPAEEVKVTLPQEELKRIVELTHFAMAQQDVRYYLNGLLLEFEDGVVRSVATDGHRLATAEFGGEMARAADSRSIIVPRKAVMEMLRMLDGGEETQITLSIGSNALRARVGAVQFTTKLIEGRFPDYRKVIPDPEACDKQVSVAREVLRQALVRVSILSNDKYRAVRLSLGDGVLRVVASNPEQEEAEDEVEVDYAGDSLEIGFNVSYLIDALAAVPAERARLYMTDANSSCLVTADDGGNGRFVVMPMRL